VFNTKVSGFQNLLESTAGDNLKHLIIFSSIAARTGNKGQVDYAMANEVLNKLAIQESAKRPDYSRISQTAGLQSRINKLGTMGRRHGIFVT